MAAMNINYTLPRGQKCQSFHIQKFVRYRKYEEEKQQKNYTTSHIQNTRSSKTDANCKVDNYYNIMGGGIFTP